MGKKFFKKQLALFVALAFVFTSVFPAAPVFAADTGGGSSGGGSGAVGSLPGTFTEVPTFEAGEPAGGYGTLELSISTGSGITTNTAIYLYLPDSTKFTLRETVTSTTSGSGIKVWTGNEVVNNTVTASAVIGVKSILQAGYTAKVTAYKNDGKADIDMLANATITVTGGYTLTLTQPSNKGGSIKVNEVTLSDGTHPTYAPAQKYNNDARFTIEATPVDDYTFVDWATTGNGWLTIDPDTETLATFTLGNRDAEILATFAEKGKANVEVVAQTWIDGDFAIVFEEVIDKALAADLAAVEADPTANTAITIPVTLPASADKDAIKTVTVNVPVEKYKAVLGVIDDSGNSVTTLEIVTHVGTVSLGSSALGNALNSALNTDERTVGAINFHISKEGITDAFPENPNDNPVTRAVPEGAFLTTIVDAGASAGYLDDEGELRETKGISLENTTITIAVPLPSPRDGYGYKVKYIGFDGAQQPTGVSYSDGKLVFTTSHLSMFAIYEEEITYTGGSNGGGGGGVTPAVTPEEEKKDDTDTAAAGSWADNPFFDVLPTDWFYGDIEFVVKHGLFLGATATSFQPQASMDRGMIVTVLGRLYGVDQSKYAAAAPEFSDVPAGAYYAPYVAWAKENGIVNGIGDGLFAPNANVSRQDFAVLILRYADFAKKQFPTTRQFSTFSDSAEIAGYAQNAIQTLYNGGIINGVGNNTINPKGSAKRAEVAAMLHRFVDAAQIELPGAAATDEAATDAETDGTESEDKTEDAESK